jgi:hypothetical protein
VESDIVRFLFEMSAREDWEPIYCTASNYSSDVGVISFFEAGQPVDSYWKQWGGWYDNPSLTRFEIFLKSNYNFSPNLVCMIHYLLKNSCNPKM